MSFHFSYRFWISRGAASRCFSTRRCSSICHIPKCSTYPIWYVAESSRGSLRGRLAKPARNYRLLLAESYLPRRLFVAMAGGTQSRLRRAVAPGSPDSMVLASKNQFFSAGIYFFPHLALAAFAAIAERFFGPKAAALAAPPLRPPSRPGATAAGFLGFTSGGSVLGAWPVDSNMIRYASWFESRGRVLERSGMMLSVRQRRTPCQAINISN